MFSRPTAHLYGRVPQLDAAAVCSACLGPVAGDFPRCYSCHCLFGNENAPSEIADAIVPMTTAINPGDWYARLVGYKNGNIEFQLTLVALVHAFISTHAPRIERFLGGAAGSLLEAGARSVALLPIARELRPPGKFRREDPWYYVERNGTYNVHDWPRP